MATDVCHLKKCFFVPVPGPEGPTGPTGAAGEGLGPNSFSTLFVFGNEGSGAPDWLHEELAATRVRIPHANEDLRSLNLSTAAGIACFEALRQTTR